MENVMIFDHPLIQHKISILRNKNTGTNEFRKNWPSLLEELVAAGDISAQTAAAHPVLMVTGLVGSIDMYDGYTFVDVPVRYADEVLKAMGHARIKGRNIHVEKATGRR